MKNNYILLHGSFSTSYSNWLPWLHQTLANENKNVLVPTFPTGIGYQNYENWKNLMDYYRNLGYINDTTTIVAHSIAPIFIIHYLLDHKIKVKKLILVCGFNNYFGINEEYDTVNGSMYTDNIEQIHDYCAEIICFYSDNDPYVKYETEREFANLVADKHELIKNGGHLNAESGYIEFKDLLKYI